MKILKKVISLNEAAKISGYHQDYLSSLLRKGELKGKKVSGNWFTTEEDVKDYIFKQEIRRSKLALGYFFSPRRRNNILIISFVTLAVLFSSVLYFYNKKNNLSVEEVETILSENNEPEITAILNNL